MAKTEVEAAIRETAFAKQVTTASGPAILIAGTVINITAPNDMDEGQAFWVEVLTRALRRGQSDTAGSLGIKSVQDTPPTHFGITGQIGRI